MHLGIISHRNVRTVSCYADAQCVLESCSKTPTGRNRKEARDGFPLGSTNRGQTTVRTIGDGSIAFKLYDTDVVVWHKDNSCTIEAYPTVTTVGFAGRFIPPGVSTSARGLIHYDATGTAGWRDRRVCRGLQPVRFVPNDQGGWEPAPEDLEHQSFRYLVLERPKARVVSKRYPWTDFKTWLELMAGHRVEIDHVEADGDTALEALEAREFRTAAEHLSVIIVNHRAWGGNQSSKLDNIVVRGPDNYVSMASVERLRNYAYADEGAFSDFEALTLTFTEFENHNKRLKHLEKAGISTHRYGI